MRVTLSNTSPRQTSVRLVSIQVSEDCDRIVGNTSVPSKSSVAVSLAHNGRGSTVLRVTCPVWRSMSNRKVRFGSGVPMILLLDRTCLLYTSDAADERSSVDLG